MTEPAGRRTARVRSERQRKPGGPEMLFANSLLKIHPACATIPFGPQAEGRKKLEPLIFQSSIARIALWGALAAWILPEIGRSVAARARGGAGPNLDRGSGWVILIGLWLTVILGIELARHVAAGTIPWIRKELFAAGILLMIVGVAFRWYAIRVLGRYFSVVVTVQREHRIIDHGPYRLIRHPSYSGTLITILGYGLALGNGLSLGVMLACGFSMYAYRVAVEERALVDSLGERYRAYMKRTKRFIPWIF